MFSGDSGLSQEGEVGRQRANLRYNVMHLQRALSALEEARMPVLVAIQGGCVGGAVDMVTAADCRYASADAWFCIHEINIGMTADVGTLQRLPKLIPEGVVRESPTPVGGCQLSERLSSDSSTRCSTIKNRCSRR